MKLKRCLIPLLAFLGSQAYGQASCSNGTIAVSFSPSGTGSTCSITSAGSGKYNVDIYRGTGQTTVVATISGTSSDRLHLVQVHNSTAYITWLYIGTSDNPFNTIDSVSSDTADGTLVLVDLHTTSHLGQDGVTNPQAIDVEQISDVRVGGDVLSPITARDSNINLLQVTGGIYKDVTAANGGIGTIDCGGNLSIINVRAKTGINFIRCATCYASIDTTYNSGTGNLGYLETTSGGFLIDSGHGELITNNIDRSTTPSGLSIAGNLIAPLTISGSVNEPIAVTGNVDTLVSIAGSLASGVTFKIGQALVTGAGHGEIDHGANGLAGQIIINSGGATSNAWGGPVKVNGTTISGAPYYTATSSSLGGGSVGQAAYHLHDEDCVPANGYSGAAPNDDIVRLHWYGPLDWTTGSPVTVEWQSGGVWIDITSSFDFTLSGSNARELQVKPKPTSPDWGNHKYRIRPTSNLNCSGVSGTPDVELSDSYEVTF